MNRAPLGMAGVLARTFIRSRLTPLLALGALFAGIFSAMRLPREEEPQINVPMFDVFVGFPGAGPKEVEERVVNVGERRLWEIPGVEYIYSTAETGGALFVVRFKVGTNPEEAMTRVYTKTFAHRDLLPPGAEAPLIKPRSIDDVPVLVLTLYANGGDGIGLRRAAALLRQEVSAVPDVSETEIFGGRRRELRVHMDPARLARHRLDPGELAGLLRATNRRQTAGHVTTGDRTLLVDTDSFIRSAGDLDRVVVGISGGRPILLSDVARVTDGPDEEEREVWTQRDGPPMPAVSLSVSKRRGANAIRVVEAAMSRVDRVKPLLPPEIQLSITRNYGATAKEKSDELLWHVLLATLSVTLLIAVVLGRREAVVVLIAVPVTLSLTLAIYTALGYTLNRITLFALIFSIGILVDDAIVVVENIHRHFAMRDGRPLWDLAVEATAEVGNPTILATWTVIAAILPMAFVGGLMGPYMRPIPVGASSAMLFSLGIAFVLAPWTFARVLTRWPLAQAAHAAPESALDRLYRRTMQALLESRRLRSSYFAVMILLLVGACSLVPLKAVIVKMLPFDNKDEFSVILTMPESSALARTRDAALEMAEALRMLPEARQVTTYVGTSAPYNFNGLVRHYFLRRRPHQAELVVHLSPRRLRRRQSHAVAREARARVTPIAVRYGARFQVAEVPPGPPVLSTLVFEIYGPETRQREALARQLRTLLESAEGIVDVDSFVPERQPRERLHVDREAATLNGIAPANVVRTVALALEGETLGIAHAEDEKEPVEIRLRLAPGRRTSTRDVRRLSLLSRNGAPIPIDRLTRVEAGEAELPIYHKNLLPVTYVVADVAGRQESPVYAVLALEPRIQAMARRSGVALRTYFARHPDGSQETALKWDGEWHITMEVFRDLGVAFAVVLGLIYLLVVAWFQSFTVPLVIMAPIPLTLVGILPGHWLMGAFFTATSMIGFIAGAGIVVRNSIILVDFIERRRREAMPLKEAVIEAGAVRFRPMLLTAAAVVVGSSVILFDPIFQGMAVALMAGEVASTWLSRMAVPVLYYALHRKKEDPIP